MYNSMLMAYLANLNNTLDNPNCVAFHVMPTCNDPIEKLATFTKLHDKINGIHILISFLEGHNIRMCRQMPHNLDLSPYILNVNIGPQLAFSYGLTSKCLIGLKIDTFVRNAKLAAAEFFAKAVFLEYVIASWFVEDREKV